MRLATLIAGARLLFPHHFGLFRGNAAYQQVRFGEDYETQDGFGFGGVDCICNLRRHGEHAALVRSILLGREPLERPDDDLFAGVQALGPTRRALHAYCEVRSCEERSDELGIRYLREFFAKSEATSIKSILN